MEHNSKVNRRQAQYYLTILSISILLVHCSFFAVIVTATVSPGESTLLTPIRVLHCIVL